MSATKTATYELRKEHEAVLLMLRILMSACARLEKGEQVDLTHIEKILEFFTVFVDTCHHGKEEQFLFPALEKAGVPKERGPIGVMLYEHEEGRAAIHGMMDALLRFKDGDKNAAASFIEHAQKYDELLRMHIEKENEILFHMADTRLAAETQQELLTDFDTLEREKIGPGKHEAFHDLLRELKQIYL